MPRFPKPFLWKPKNPQKYVGDPSKITSRSSWETRLFSYLDKNESVISWNSEDIVVKYISPVDGRMHNYHIDVVAKMKTRSGEIKTFAIEVKPEVQTLPPKNTPSKKREVLLEEVETYLINQAKWEAASKFFKERGATFIVMTEYDMGIAKRKQK